MIKWFIALFMLLVLPILGVYLQKYDPQLSGCFTMLIGGCFMGFIMEEL